MFTKFTWLAALVTGHVLFAHTTPEGEVRSFVEAELKKPSSALRSELKTVEEFCLNGSCKAGMPDHTSVTLVDGLYGKQGYSVYNYLVTLTYTHYGSGLSRHEALPLLVVRTTHYGKPSYELAAVLKFGSLTTRLKP